VCPLPGSKSVRSQRNARTSELACRAIEIHRSTSFDDWQCIPSLALAQQVGSNKQKSKSASIARRILPLLCRALPPIYDVKEQHQASEQPHDQRIDDPQRAIARRIVEGVLAIDGHPACQAKVYNRKVQQGDTDRIARALNVIA
jgi:hypothetical protein